MPANPNIEILRSAAGEYGADPRVLIEMARMESGFRTGAVNDWDSNAAAGTPSKGLLQFIEPTFSSFARQAQAANPRAWQGVNADWLDPRAQALAAAWAIQNGKGSHWTTYKRAIKAAGGKAVPGGTTSDTRVGLLNSPEISAGPKLDLGSYYGKGDRLGALVQQQYDLLTGLNQPQASSAPQSRGLAAPIDGGMDFDAPGRKKGESGWQYLQRIGRTKFGLENDPGDSQTIGGRHSDGSEHYDGRAIDFGTARNSRPQLNAWLKWARAQGFDAIDEGDHIHVSLPGSGI